MRFEPSPLSLSIRLTAPAARWERKHFGVFQSGWVYCKSLGGKAGPRQAVFWVWSRAVHTILLTVSAGIIRSTCCQTIVVLIQMKRLLETMFTIIVIMQPVAGLFSLSMSYRSELSFKVNKNTASFQYLNSLSFSASEQRPEAAALHCINIIKAYFLYLNITCY